jgi:hypothetical protein
MSTAPTANPDNRSVSSAARAADEVAQDVSVDVASPSSPGAHGPSSVLTAVEIGAASFPASDPPASWTWDVPQSAPRS